MEDDNRFNSNDNENKLDSLITPSTTIFNSHEMDSSNDNFNHEVLREDGEQSISAEWSATTSALNSSGTSLSKSGSHIDILKECCANPSDTLKHKEHFMVMESSLNSINVTNINANDTQSLSTPKAAFQNKHKPHLHNFSNVFENIIDNDSQMEITQNSIKLNRFQQRPRFLTAYDEDFVEINKSDNSGMDSAEVSIKSPKFRFLNKNKNQSYQEEYNITTYGTSITDYANLSKIKENAIFKEPSELPLENNCSKTIMDDSKIKIFTPKFISKKMDASDSVFDNVVCLNHTYDIPEDCNPTEIGLSRIMRQSNNETYTVENDLTLNKSNYTLSSSGIAKNCTLSDTYTLENKLNDTFTQSNYSNKRQNILTDMSNTYYQSNLPFKKHTKILNDKPHERNDSKDIEVSHNKTLPNITAELLENNSASSDRLLRSRSKSLLAPHIDTHLSFESIKSSSSLKYPSSDTSMNISKKLKFTNYQKLVGQSAAFENVITNSQKSNMSLPQNNILDISELKDQSKVQVDEISLIADTDTLLCNSKLIRQSNNNTSEVDVVKNGSESSSTTKLLKENVMEVSNVSIDDNLHKHSNSLNSENSQNESLPNITADLTENKIISTDRLLRSRSKSLMASHIDTNPSFELNTSSSSLKHFSCDTPMNISKKLKFTNYQKLVGQSTAFENVITNSQKSNLSQTQNNMLDISELRDQSKVQVDEISLFADTDTLLCNSKLIRQSNNNTSEVDVKNGSESSSTTELLKENVMEESNVSIDDNIHEHGNSLHSENSQNESLPNITAGLSENKIISTDRLLRSRSKSLMASHIVTNSSFESNTSSSSTKHSSCDTSMNISKKLKFTNYQKLVGQSAAFENVITNSQKSNLSQTQNKMLNISELKDQSKVQVDEISLFADTDTLLCNSKLIRQSNNNTSEVDVVKNSSESSSTTELLKENVMEVSNVSIDDNLHKHSNSLNSENSLNESLPNITAGLSENKIISTDRLLRSRSKSLMASHIDTNSSFESNTSSSSTKHSSSNTCMNVSEKLKFTNYQKLGGQSAAFENVITNSQKSNLSLTQNKMLNISELKDQSKAQVDEISLFAETDMILSNSKLIRQSNHNTSEVDIIKNCSKSSLTTGLLKENVMKVSNVSIDDNLYGHGNSLNSENIQNESMPNFTAGLSENKITSTDHLLRSSSKTLLSSPIDNNLSFESNQSSGSSKHSSCDTSMNISKKLKFTNHQKLVGQSAAFENVIENGQKSNLSLTQNKISNNSALNDQVQVDENSIFGKADKSLSKSKLISHSKHNTSKASSSKTSKGEVDVIKNFSKCSTTQLPKEDSMDVDNVSIDVKLHDNNYLLNAENSQNESLPNVTPGMSENNGSSDRLLSSRSKSKSVENVATVNELLTPINNKINVAESIVKTIVRMSVHKRKSGHPGVFQFEDLTNKPKTCSLDQSNSFLTKALDGNKNNEPESTTSALSYSETFIDQSQTKVIVAEKFKSLYNKEPWITKRLYSFLINKLQPRYSIFAVKYAEKFVKYLALRLKDIMYNKIDFQLCSDMLRYHMARFEIITTTFDYLNFLSNYIPKMYFDKLVPETFQQRFDPNKYLLPIMDDEEFLNEVLAYLNAE